MEVGQIFEMQGKRFEFIEKSTDSQGKYVKAWELGKNGQRRFIVTIRPS